MTAMTKLLLQRSTLCRRAVAETSDVNEAYLIVHQVMARAFGAARCHDPDLGPALSHALDEWARPATAGAAL
jgi:hypothetical protein